MMPFSKYKLERIGTAFIAEQLYREGLKLALPDIDEGIDLIVYSDDTKSFRAIPIQIKAFSQEAFYTDKKYLKIPDLRIVYLWHVGTEQPIRAFGMLYREAEKIVDNNGWTRDTKGRYVRTEKPARKLRAKLAKPPKKLTEALKPFEIAESWRHWLFKTTTTRNRSASTNSRSALAKKGR